MREIARKEKRWSEGGLKQGALGAPGLSSQGKCLQKGGASGKIDFSEKGLCWVHQSKPWDMWGQHGQGWECSCLM